MEKLKEKTRTECYTVYITLFSIDNDKLKMDGPRFQQ